MNQIICNNLAPEAIKRLTIVAKKLDKILEGGKS